MVLTNNTTCSVVGLKVLIGFYLLIYMHAPLVS